MSWRDSFWNRLNHSFSFPDVKTSFSSLKSVLSSERSRSVCSDRDKQNVKRKEVSSKAMNNQTREREKNMVAIPKQQKPKTSKEKKTNKKSLVVFLKYNISMKAVYSKGYLQWLGEQPNKGLLLMESSAFSAWVRKLCNQWYVLFKFRRLWIVVDSDIFMRYFHWLLKPAGSHII